MVQAAVWPQPCACIGQLGVPQQDGLAGRFFRCHFMKLPAGTA